MAMDLGTKTHQDQDRASFNYASAAHDCITKASDEDRMSGRGNRKDEARPRVSRSARRGEAAAAAEAAAADAAPVVSRRTRARARMRALMYLVKQGFGAAA